MCLCGCVCVCVCVCGCENCLNRELLAALVNSLAFNLIYDRKHVHNSEFNIVCMFINVAVATLTVSDAIDQHEAKLLMIG